MISVMNPIVETRGGKVRGSVVDGIMTFKGIPYAAPPFGATGSFPRLKDVRLYLASPVAIDASKRSELDVFGGRDLEKS